MPAAATTTALLVLVVPAASAVFGLLPVAEAVESRPELETLAETLLIQTLLIQTLIAETLIAETLLRVIVVVGALLLQGHASGSSGSDPEGLVEPGEPSAAERLCECRLLQLRRAPRLRPANPLSTQSKGASQWRYKAMGVRSVSLTLTAGRFVPPPPVTPAGPAISPPPPACCRRSRGGVAAAGAGEGRGRGGALGSVAFRAFAAKFSVW